jgi:hypothetical protein
MEIKTDNYFNLNLFNDWLDENMLNPNRTNDDGRWFSNSLLAELRLTKVPGVKFHDSHATIGDINISLTDKLSKVKNKVASRLSKVGNREELYTKYGFDTKFGMHLVRLMLEGKELLLTGEIQYPLKEREMLVDIRNGKWKKEDIIAYSEQLESEIEGLVATSPLQKSPPKSEINKLLIGLIERSWDERR